MAAPHSSDLRRLHKVTDIAMDIHSADVHLADSLTELHPGFDTTRMRTSAHRCLVVHAVREAAKLVGMPRGRDEDDTLELHGSSHDPRWEHHFRVHLAKRDVDGELIVLANAGSGLLPSSQRPNQPMFREADPWVYAVVLDHNGTIDEIVAAHVIDRTAGRPGRWVFDEEISLGGGHRNGALSVGFTPDPDDHLDGLDVDSADEGHGATGA